MALDTGNPFLDALGGSPWNKRVIRYIFDDLGSPGGAWTQDEQAAFDLALLSWMNVADIVFLETNRPGSADLFEQKVTNAEIPGSATGQHDFPDDPTQVGQLNRIDGQYEVNTTWTAAAMRPGGSKFQLFIHELGHAIGLAHTHDDGMGTGLFPGVDGFRPDGTSIAIDRDVGDNGLNSRLYTVMSYVRTNANLPSADRSNNFGHAATPMAFDIAAVQLLYGAVHNATGNNVYELPDSNSASTGYRCIWDTRGIDTIRYDGVRDATIDLRPAHLQNAVGGGGFVSSAQGIQGGFTIAADSTGFIPDVNGEWGVIIENATGGSGNDILVGNAARNILRGNAGNDHLNGFGGADSLVGGLGDDEYVVDHAGDKVFDSSASGGRDTIFAFRSSYDLAADASGQRIEVLRFAGAGDFIGWGSSLDNTLIGGDGADTLYGRDGHDDLVGDDGGDRLDGGNGNDTLSGQGGEDSLYGRDGNDSLSGSLDNDILYGSGGNDTLSGSFGRDTLSGGVGDDLYVLGSSVDVDVIIEAAGPPGGVDTVRSNRSSTVLAANVENLTLSLIASSNQVGQGNDLSNVISGSGGANTLLGLDGNDTINGAGGNDTIEGGLGDDMMSGGAGEDRFRYRGSVSDIGGDNIIGGTLALDDARDTLDFSGLAGPGVSVVVDLAVRFFQGYSFGTVVSGGVIGGIDNVIGSVGDDALTGGSGADSLSGGAGFDTLTGGAGADTLWGGNDNDLIVADNLDLINGGSGFDTVRADAGTAAFTFSLFRTQIEVVEGSSGDDVIDATRISTSVTLSGADGDDTLTGGNVGDNLGAGDGADSVVGGGGADFITGGEGDDTLDGGVGNDTLVGGAGADTLSGGADNDIIHTDGLDAINGGSGFDSVRADAGTIAAGFSFALAGRLVEDVWGHDGDDVIDATGVTTAVSLFGGNEGADTLIGGSGNDTLVGLGADSMAGGGGNDFFDTDLLGQISGGGGSDTVRTFGATAEAGFSFALAPASIEAVIGNIGNDSLDATGVSENVTLNGLAGDNTLIGGDGNDSLTSGGDDDLLSGADGDDVLWGGWGSDTMDGGEGNDALSADTGADSLTGGNGDDLLWMLDNDDTVSGGAGIDDAWAGDQTATGGFAFTVAGSGVERIKGNAGNDSIDGSGVSEFLDLQGEAGDDTLTGGDAGDTFIGGAGADSLTGGAGGDRFYFFDGWGADRIADFAVGSDEIDMTFVTGLDSFGQLAITDVAGGAQVAFGGNTFVLELLAASQVSESDFLL